MWNDLPLMQLIEARHPHAHHLPAAHREKVDMARESFRKAFEAHDWGSYTYFYCTKSNHFSYVIEQVLKKGVNLETSSAYDLDMVELLLDSGRMRPDATVLCNGFRTNATSRNIGRLTKRGMRVIPIIDNLAELPAGQGDRRALRHRHPHRRRGGPKFEFYTSRLGIGYKDIIPFYLGAVSRRKKFR